MLLRLGRLNNCLSLGLFGISLVVVLQYLLEALEKESAREVRHPVPLLHQKDLNLMTNQLFCQKEDGVYFEDPSFECALKSQEKTAASCRSGRSRRAAPVFQSSPR